MRDNEVRAGREARRIPAGGVRLLAESVVIVGGNRVGAGRPPNENALRRDRKDDAGWELLPSEGRQGAPPEWPLTKARVRELELWRRLWAKPQALIWERQDQVLEVALHVRTFAEAEKPDAFANLRTLARQQADALLLTIPAMRQARVRIAVDEVAAQRSENERTVKAAKRAPARERMKRMQGGEAAS